MSFLLTIVSSFLPLTLFAYQTCSEVFNPPVFEISKTGLLGFNRSAQGLFIKRGTIEGQMSVTVKWQGNTIAPYRLNPSHLGKADSEMLGPFRSEIISSFLGPRLFVSSSQIGSRFRAEIIVRGMLFTTDFTIRRNPTLIGFRAVDFKNENGVQLKHWPDSIEEFRIRSLAKEDSDISLYGNPLITFNPTYDNLKSTNQRGDSSLIQYLLRGQNLSNENLLTDTEIETFVNAYHNLHNLKNIDFARNLEKNGVFALRSFLRGSGFDTLPLKGSGQLPLKDYLSQFSRDKNGFLVIPYEQSFFGSGHGYFSHALQITALLYGLNLQERQIIRKVLGHITSTNNENFWLAWVGLFNGFAGDGPHTTAWWPN